MAQARPLQMAPPAQSSPAPAPQVGTKRPATEGEQRAAKRRQELIADDARRLLQTDIHRPFSNLEDAIERLLPYHLLGAEDGGAADLDETSDHAGAGLLAGRDDAWRDIVLDRTRALAKQSEALDARLAELEEKHSDPLGVMPEDRVIIDRFLFADAKRKFDEEAKKHQPVAPPAPPAASAVRPSAAVRPTGPSTALRPAGNRPTGTPGRPVGMPGIGIGGATPLNMQIMAMLQAQAQNQQNAQVRGFCTASAAVVHA